MATYLSLNRYLRDIFGERIQKVPLDAGLSCPNRDGTKGIGGCIYCGETGSGTGAHATGQAIREQMRKGQVWAARRYKAKKFIAYFQSYSNTYAPMAVLERIYRQALTGPEVVGMAIGTRPDCIDRDVLKLIERIGKGHMIWMEYGLQSACDATLKRINRGHSVQDFIDAVDLTRQFGFPVCAHVIFGLPGEDTSQMKQTIELLADLRIDGIKFHQLYVETGTRLHTLYSLGKYKPISLEQYAELVAWSVSRLPRNTVIHRLTGDPRRSRLAAPGWSLKKQDILNAICERIEA